ncbi:RNA 2',3'-cyclic phosphodiesterase [Paractinoplanes toevensis]|uniref:RNA 2',3'-cyclic phosphodiesterase n=1 Tax=Paractinoplanes toevensis TaxID=571911 RepID=A0A919WCS2_9ACTN|nr:RNA 2',3'-cyclic phosphodiesterase [Actinoplanes toevensis]
MSALSRALPPDARLTRAAKWHVTLVFLGPAPPAPVAPVAQILNGLTALPSPFSLRLAGAGQFGNVTWAGVGGDLDALGELRSQIREALTAGGFPSDDRPYQPHVTVSYRADHRVRAALSNYSGADWPVREFALVNSHDGEYETLQAWPLAT